MLIENMAAMILAANSHGIGADPSLSIGSFTGTTVALTQSLPSSLLDYKGIVIEWDDVNDEFIVSIDEQAVTDLVTFINEDGWLAFEGEFVSGEPTLSGWIVSEVEGGSEYTVQLYLLPGLNALSLDVEHDGVVPDVVAGRSCECNDNFSFGCKPGNDCDEARACGISGASNKYVWKDTVVARP